MLQDPPLIHENKRTVERKPVPIPCFHCGDACHGNITADDRSFCCNGCRQVYLLLNENGLCDYYALDKNPGIQAKGKFTGERFAYLDDPAIIKKIVLFSSDKQTNVRFDLPQIHCSSCIYLLENLRRINPGIISSRSNFQRKEIFISFDQNIISLRKVVELLAFVGYEPSLSLDDLEPKDGSGKKKQIAGNRRIHIYRLGVAGFCFANIMMLSFPEYFSAGHIDQPGLKQTFTWLCLFLSLPVLLFSAGGIFSSAWKALRQRTVNIDAPIALAIVVTFARSYYEIITGTGAGWLDSGTGIVFFMLIGRWFQSKTYESLSFDRDYRSYFPLGVTLLKGNEEKNIPVTKLKKGDRFVVRNEEMIPADSILIKGDANIDYSFVSGENDPVPVLNGALIYAGGKQSGLKIELEVVKDVSQSYITELWNSEAFSATKNKEHSFIHPWSRYFTLALFAVASTAVIFWWINDPSKLLPALTSVLIVACPCSLLLSATFTNGNMLRIFGRNKLYVKNASVIESLASIDTIVLDKTGTITQPNRSLLSYEGIPLTEKEKEMIGCVARQSCHPLSRIIASQLQTNSDENTSITQFKEYPGRGLSAMVDDVLLKLGSAAFVNELNKTVEDTASHVHVQIGNQLKGIFAVGTYYRSGLKKEVDHLTVAGYELHVLSGDNDAERSSLQYIFGPNVPMLFREDPAGKLLYIKQQQLKHKKVLMIGDGLNDAGALKQADVGIAVNESNTQFSPACDAIMDGSQVANVGKLLDFAKAGKKIITASFILSILYNLVGLSFAVTANLSPMVAAILMPASSISIVVFVTLATNAVARKKGL